jgi:hypothetical protein
MTESQLQAMSRTGETGELPLRNAVPASQVFAPIVPQVGGRDVVIAEAASISRTHPEYAVRAFAAAVLDCLEAGRG